MDDWSVKIAHRTNLHRVARCSWQSFAIAMDIYQHAAVTQVRRITQAIPPSILRLECKWHTYLSIAFCRLYLLRWRKAGVSHAISPVVGKKDNVAAAVGQAAGNNEMVFSGYRRIVILRGIAAWVFRQPAVQHIAIFDGHGATGQQ